MNFGMLKLNTMYSMKKTRACLKIKKYTKHLFIASLS